MAAFLRSYNSALLRRPMLMQCLTGSFLVGAGDILAQQAFEKKGLDHDFVRTARLTLYRGLLLGPPLTLWYNILNRINYASPTKALASKVFLDQVVFSPVAIVLFFGSMSILEGRPEDAIPRIQEASVTTLVHSWIVYTPTQILNFSLMPPHLRAVFISSVSVFWNAYLSIANRRFQTSSHSDRNIIAGESVDATVYIKQVL